MKEPQGTSNRSEQSSHTTEQAEDMERIRPYEISPPPYEESHTMPEIPVAVPAWLRLRVASQENFANSPLLGLPDNVLVNIMNNSSTETIFRLRHVSRTFMRLFTEYDDFEGLWLNDHGAQLSHAWMAPCAAYPGQGKPKFCSHCEKIRGTCTEEELIHEMKKLWCSGCKQFHSEIHFSQLQRAELEDSARNCIGLEGRVKICSHRSIGWSQIRSWAKTGSKAPMCGRAVHEDAYCSHKTCKYTNGPQIAAKLNEDGMYVVDFVTTSHVPFGRGPAGEKPTWISVFRGIQEAMSKKEDEGHLRLGRLFAGCDPLRAFDPNHCSCLDWLVDQSELESSPENGFKWLLGDRDSGDWRDLAVPENGDYAGGELLETDPDTDRCYGWIHGFTEVVGNSTVGIEFAQCGDDGSMIVLLEMLRIVVEGPADPAWEQLLDMESLFQDTDGEMLGKTWCNDEQCAVSKRNRTGRSLGQLEYNLTHGISHGDNNDDYYDADDNYDVGGDYDEYDDYDDYDVDDVDDADSGYGEPELQA
ncbi:hypothetical protein NLG97_g2715 [Lecanicillium saksenae]|uniref:Uncharacterized protein n=1 Tax=Lecanicillium saksenae TaxID=468837 RepID=A0ACC1R1E1_9HYPO|nr:hypothetical protein NLG97_g2715 [Lecanicillium saksenae]